MNFTLVRQDNLATGIFGKLVSDNGIAFATLEHAYPEGNGWVPKLPAGMYNCVRGHHQLHSGPIEAFEVLGVPGHKGILIHPGNTEGESEGCILIGMSRLGDAILESRKAFDRFMLILGAFDEFVLTVR